MITFKSWDETLDAKGIMEVKMSLKLSLGEPSVAGKVVLGTVLLSMLLNAQ